MMVSLTGQAYAVAERPAVAVGARRDAGAGFRSLTEHIDTTIPAGRMLMQMLGGFADLERAMIRERTRSGLAAARAKGRAGGRRPKLNPYQRREAIAMVESGSKSAADVARLFKVHRTTISRVLAAASVGAKADPMWPLGRTPVYSKRPHLEVMLSCPDMAGIRALRSRSSLQVGLIWCPQMT